jgi:hypothetical protein
MDRCRLSSTNHCCSDSGGAGFANELLVAADNTDEIELVDGHRLYNGA